MICSIYTSAYFLMMMAEDHMIHKKEERTKQTVYRKNLLMIMKLERKKITDIYFYTPRMPL